MKLALLSKLSKSVSFAKTSRVTELFSLVLATSITATGASFVPVIVTVTVFVLNARIGASSITCTV